MQSFEFINLPSPLAGVLLGNTVKRLGWMILLIAQRYPENGFSFNRMYLWRDNQVSDSIINNTTVNMNDIILRQQ